jgi:hypothetical protein
MNVLPHCNQGTNQLEVVSTETNIVDHDNTRLALAPWASTYRVVSINYLNAQGAKATLPFATAIFDYNTKFI